MTTPDDPPVGDVPSLIRWLDAKYARHKEIEDYDAARALERLYAAAANRAAATPSAGSNKPTEFVALPALQDAEQAAGTRETATCPKCGDAHAEMDRGYVLCRECGHYLPNAPPPAAPAHDALVDRLRAMSQWEQDGGNGGSLTMLINEAADAIEARDREKARLQKDWERECADGDAVLITCALDPALYRTNGGGLNVPKIRVAIGARQADRIRADIALQARAVAAEALAERLRLVLVELVACDDETISPPYTRWKDAWDNARKELSNDQT